MTIEINGKVTTIAQLNGIINSDTDIDGAVSLGGTIIGASLSERGLKGERGAKGDTGETGNGITDIEYLSSLGNVDTYKITFSDGNETTFEVTNGIDGQDGTDGADGFSPIANVTKAGDTATISITDSNGTTTATVSDGADGNDGADGQDGYSPSATVSKVGDTATITITDKDGTTTASVSDGADGQDGQDGQDGADGFSPSASVSKSGNKSTITITDKDGTTTADVYDGGGASALIAEYGVTTYADVKDAYDEDAIIICTVDDSGNTVICQLAYYDDENGLFYFAQPQSDGFYLAIIASDDTWDDSYFTFASTETATQLRNGLMDALDKQKLDGIASGAEVNVQSDWNQSTNTADDYIKNKPTIPSKTSDLNNDSGFITGMTILSYGNSTWQNFIDAYNANKVVYCRASSNSNPGSGSQTRLAFMAYVNNATTPTEVEFQYYRSVSSHSASQQGDQVFVYKLNKTNGWSVTTREASSKIVAGTGLSSSYSSGVLTLTSSGEANVQSDWNEADNTKDDYIKNKPTIPTKVSELNNDSGFITTESDPVFTASDAYGIDSTDITNWDNSYDGKVSLDTSAQSGTTDGDLYAAIVALGWGNDVIE